MLGFNVLEDYLRYSQNYGANCGRAANRIANASSHLGGRDYQLDKNFLGKHCLHGGKQGYSKRNWRLIKHSDDSACLELLDADGDSGFPRALSVRCEYKLLKNATLQLKLTATAIDSTVCSLAHHSYFCLDASGDTRDRLFTIYADSYYQ